MFDDIEQTATFIRDAIRDIPERHKQNNIEIHRLQGEQQDLLHFIEFNNVGTVQAHKYYKDLQDVRQKRRALKDENELLEPLAERIKKFKEHLTALDQVVGEIRKLQNNQKVRSYKCRVREDLQDQFIS